MITNIFKRTNKIFIVFLLISCFFSCVRNRPAADVSSISIQLSIRRFEKALFSLKQKEVEATNIKALRQEYPVFFDLFTNQIISIQSKDDTLLAGNLQKFLTDRDIDSVYQIVMKDYLDMKDVESSLNEGFKHYKFHFPKKPIPEILTYLSGFNYSIINADNAIGIGLDMYLGNSCKYYAGLNFPQYKTRRMQREYIAFDCMKSWGMSEYEQSPQEQQNLLAEMIYNGKILYFANAMLPEVADTIKTGYTNAQLDFCKKNESKIWSMFMENKLLFSSNQKQYLKYVTDGPSTSGLPKNAPAMIGAWMGLRIVEAYMKNKPEISLEQLMKNKDSNGILSNSNYKPEK